MSCSYFILSKSKDKKVDDHQDISSIVLLNKNNYLLPYNNISYYLKNGLFESNLIEWCKQFGDPEKVMLDIGSHTGIYSISLSPYFNQIYAFEPQKMTYYALCGSVALSAYHNIECINNGLGSEDQVGECDLHIISEDGGGSTVLSNVSSNVLKKEKIYIKTLDSFHLKNIGFIKMDIEGNELNALKGALNTLSDSNYPRILFEKNKNDKDDKDDKDDKNNIFSYLTKLGYKIIKIRGYSNMFLCDNV